MFGGGNTFKPKHGKKSFLPVPATFSNLQRKGNFVYMVVIVVVMWYLFNPLHYVSNLFTSTQTPTFPSPHPFSSSHIIETTSRYIFPPIEDTPLLKELTVHQLVKESKVRDSNFPEIEKNVIRPLNDFDDKDATIQKAKEDEENALSGLAKAKNAFKNQDKVVFRPKKNQAYPDVVIVSAIDFVKHDQDALTKIVQNRIDYGYAQKYGVYIRWSEEFLPKLNSLSYLNSKEKAKWVRLYCLRAAMFAFPEAKWFWYIDQDGLIMNLSINILDYILSPDVLDPIMLREQAIIPPDGTIKTYKNTRAKSVQLIVTQSEQKVETTSFLVKNDEIGKAIVEIWGDELYLNYQNFPYGPDSALTHILQWHPFILSKTTIVPARTISAKYVKNLKEENKKGDKYNYYEGDFVAHWADCEGKDCPLVLKELYEKVVR